MISPLTGFATRVANGRSAWQRFLRDGGIRRNTPEALDAVRGSGRLCTGGSLVGKVPIYNRTAMKTTVVLCLALCLSACTKPAAPTAANGTTSSIAPGGVLEQVQQYAGSGATNCGGLDVHASPADLKTVSACALEASKEKRPFYVAYDMPGMSVGIAGDSEGKLFTVQAQGTGTTPILTSGACPAELRLAASGRVTCFAPGDMGSMSASHAGADVPAGMPNPHSGKGGNPLDVPAPQ
jgi:hypothetical protein